MADADAYLLEPIMQMTIAVPEDTVGDVIGDLNLLAQAVDGAEGVGDEIKAEAPMAEVLDYAPDLRATTKRIGGTTRWSLCATRRCLGTSPRRSSPRPRPATNRASA